MYWLILGVLCAVFAVTTLLLWQKWAAPWPQIEQLVSQIARGERPSTFLINGGPDLQRVGLALETISAHQQELERQIALKENQISVLLGRNPDAVLYVRDLERSKSELQEKILDLEKFEEVVVGRELKMIALEKELESLQDEVKTLRADGA
jgi:hypothetical protein